MKEEGEDWLDESYYNGDWKEFAPEKWKLELQRFKTLKDAIVKKGKEKRAEEEFYLRRAKYYLY